LAGKLSATTPVAARYFSDTPLLNWPRWYRRPGAGSSGLTGRRRGRRCGLEGQEVSDADDPEHLPFQRADIAPGLIVKQARGDQLDGPSASPQLASARGQDVLDPGGIRAVGQGQDITVLGGEQLTGV
jgi:hypothetical protein